MSTKHLCKPESCSGCLACMAACPKQAISVRYVFLGQVLPYIDTDKCVDCGMCDKTCPSLNNPPKTYPLLCYASWTKDNNDYLTTTSGGIATAMAKNVISEGGIVYGCVAEGLNVRHVRCASLESIENLKGSKYVQSDCSAVFPLIRKDLKEGLKVLFIGTPCQCAGVKGFLKKSYDNLILVDLICHGVPSMQFLKECLYKKFPKLSSEQIHGIKFRENSRYVFVMNISLGSENIRFPLNPNNMYYQTFFYGNTYRDSCYSCQFANPNRCSDITIGDFWGINDVDVIKKANKGVSCVLLNTEKAKRFFDAIGDVYKYEQPVNDAINGNAQLKSPTRMTLRTKMFRNLSHFISSGGAYNITWLDKILIYRSKEFIKRILRWQK